MSEDKNKSNDNSVDKTKKSEWENDLKLLKESRKNTIKKIKEWEKAEDKNITDETDKKPDFTIISELKKLDELKKFIDNVPDEWKQDNPDNPSNFIEKSDLQDVKWAIGNQDLEDNNKWLEVKKEFGQKLWKKFWDKPDELWDENPDLFSLAVEKLKKLDRFDDIRKEWEKVNRGKNFDHFFPHPDWLVKETMENCHPQTKKKFGDVMNIIAFVGLAIFGLLIIFSGICATANCAEEVTTSVMVNGVPTVITERPNIPLQILESQLMLVFLTTIVGPVVLRILKERYDIQIETSQFNMIVQDAIKAVKMYSTEASKLRDKNGKLDEVSQRKLRNVAFAAIRDNYEPNKYKELAKNLGVQVFEKAIENAVIEDKLKRLPIEQEKIKELISQAIDAVPQIVKWVEKDDETKKAFLDGHVRRLLASIGIEGWAYKQLENIFDADVNNRLLAAAIAEKNKLFKDIQDRNLLYTTTVLSSVFDSMAKNPKINTK